MLIKLYNIFQFINKFVILIIFIKKYNLEKLLKSINLQIKIYEIIEI